MTTTIRVVPAPGLLIPDPAQRGTPDYHLPPEGRDVQPDDYWTRRARDGDVLVAAAGGDTATDNAAPEAA